MRTKEEILRETINDKKYRFVDHITNETLEAVLEAMQIYADQSQEPKQRDEVELHKCKWCNVMTTQSDDVCYANPNNRPEQREEVVQDVLDSMIGIGGIPSNEEFYNEFNFRLQNKLGIKQTDVSEEDNNQ